MKTRRLDKNGDWVFGQGIANYLKDNDAILQDVVTRLKSFKNDWFLDTEANIDWFGILGSKENKETIKNEVIRVTLQTYGVLKINEFEMIKIEDRSVKISLNLDTIYSINNELGVEI
jgi:hypothetical protein